MGTQAKARAVGRLAADLGRVMVEFPVNPGPLLLASEVNEWAGLPADRLTAALAAAVGYGLLVKEGDHYRRAVAGETVR